MRNRLRRLAYPVNSISNSDRSLCGQLGQIRAGKPLMAFVVTAPCLGCKYTDCVVDCPMDCFHEADQMLYIDPEECIDCGACVPECPVEAIFYEDNVLAEWQEFIALNAEMSAKAPQITQRKTPLAPE